MNYYEYQLNSSSNALQKDKNGGKLMLDANGKNYSNIGFESELNKLRHEYESIIDSIYDEIFVTDEKGYVIFVNKAAERLYNRKAEDIIGRNVQELEEEEFFTPSITNLVRRTQKMESVIQTTKTDQKILVTAMPIFNEKGQLTKIVSNSRQLNELVSLCKELEEKEMLIRQYSNEIRQLRTINMGESLYYTSNIMEKVSATLSKVAPSDISILLLGESGVGKSMIANYIHNISNRCHGPFQLINCSAIPETLLESELFGYDKGAFTGAVREGKAGLFELAKGGTIFLDEVGDIPYYMQVKLLQVIQERKYRRVGSVKELKADFRIITATNQDLSKKIKDKTFREDLYYRINGISITIPPLRERKEDISILAHKFIEELNQKYGKTKRFDKKVLDVFNDYQWQGNVRELKNLIERLYLVSEKDIIVCDDIPDYICTCSGKHDRWIEKFNGKDLSLKRINEMVEEEVFKAAYLKYKNSYRVAKALGISQPTAYRKMKKYLQFIDE